MRLIDAQRSRSRAGTASSLSRDDLARRGIIASEQAGQTLVPRCVKDLIEERLFARRRDLFSAEPIAGLVKCSRRGGASNLGRQTWHRRTPL